jgi:hypothetical protein
MVPRGSFPRPRECGHAVLPRMAVASGRERDGILHRTALAHPLCARAAGTLSGIAGVSSSLLALLAATPSSQTFARTMGKAGPSRPCARKTHTLDAGVVAEEERRRCSFNPKLHANSGVWAVRPSFLTWPAVVARPAAALNVRSGPVNGLPLRFEAKRSSAPESEEAERGTSRPFVGDLSEGVQALIFRVCSAS